MAKKFALVVALVVVTACGPGPAGPAGPAGAQGPQGQTGATGATGAAGKDGVGLAFESLCTLNEPQLFQYFVHDIYVFADGSVLAKCEVSGTSTTSSNTSTVSSMTIYKKEQKGAATAACSLFADRDNYGAGWWSFESSGPFTSTTATYHEPGNGSDGLTRHFLCTRY